MSLTEAIGWTGLSGPSAAGQDKPVPVWIRPTAAGYEWLATHDEDWRRAIEVQGALWRGGRIRAVGLPDLLIAAVAERERVTVVHYDGDYELIAQVTGQPVRWVVPRGTVS